MSIWTQLEPLLHKTVDGLLSDEILYSVAGGQFVAVEGFVLLDEGMSEFVIDELAAPPVVKISRDLIPQPALGHRLQCLARLGPGVWRPTTKQPRENSRYWIFNIQKA